MTLTKTTAFTLSETLIALVVIGIISAVTIPILTAQWQKTRTVVSLKKAYSILSQTTNRAIADNGPIASWEVLELSNREFAEKYIKPYVNIMQDKSSDTFKYKSLNKHELSQNVHTFYLSDGMKFGVSTPVDSEWGITSSIYVDINGDTKPNIMSRDVFHFIYWIIHYNSPSTSGKFLPYGGNWSRDLIINGSHPYNCRKDKTGDLCAALIMKDGWMIKSDYPW